MKISGVGGFKRVVQLLGLASGLAALTPSFSNAASVTLAWDPSPDPTVTGYNVYTGSSSRTYTNVLNAKGATTAVVSNLVPGVTYYFAATTYTGSGLESDYSVEASYTVPAVVGTNQPPTLDQPANIVLLENSAPQSITLAGISSGSASEMQTLSVSAFSSNPAIVPNPTVHYTSPASTALLTVAPAANSYGSVTLTVMVDDGGVISNTVIRSFTVTVNPLNFPPTLDPLNDIVLDQGAPAQTVALFGISAGGNENQTLTVTAASSNPGLVPAPAVSYVSPNATGSLQLAPLPGVSGSARITVTVNDGQTTDNLFSQAFTVRVNPAAQSTVTNGSWTLWWQNQNGNVSAWQMQETNKVAGGLLQPSHGENGARVVGSGDFDGDGLEDLIWKQKNGTLTLWLMNGTNRLTEVTLDAQVEPGWRVAATGDIDGDGHKDLLLQHTNGWLGFIALDGTNAGPAQYLHPARIDPSWRLAGTADFRQIGHTDLLFQHKDGWLSVWFMDGTNRVSASYLNPSRIDPTWSAAGTTAFQPDGTVDIIWRQNSTGLLRYWAVQGTNRIRGGTLNPRTLNTVWRLAAPR